MYIDKNILKYPQNKSVFDKVRNSKADEALKFKIIKGYNEKLNNLPAKYNPEYDLSVLMDLQLDLFRFKRTNEIIIDHPLVLKDLKKFGVDNYKLSSFLNTFVGHDFYKKIF